MANINSQWRRFIAAGCTHGLFACPQAQDAVLAFCESWKPHSRYDLGDIYDMTAFRTGAKGTKDESASVELDFLAGSNWLDRYHPTHRCNGNHDHRIYKLLDHPNAIVAHAAGVVAESIRKVDAKNKTIVKPYDIDQYFTLGDTKLFHGVYFNENAIRDHAESHGRVIIAHLHRPGEATGRRIDRPTAWCVGTLGDPKKFEYAAARRATLGWAHGFVWGEYNDKRCVVRLERQECGHGVAGAEEWRLPL